MQHGSAATLASTFETLFSTGKRILMLSATDIYAIARGVGAAQLLADEAEHGGPNPADVLSPGRRRALRSLSSCAGFTSHDRIGDDQGIVRDGAVLAWRHVCFPGCDCGGRALRIKRRVSRKRGLSGVVNSIRGCRRTSSKVVVSRGSCCRLTFGIGCELRAITPAMVTRLQADRLRAGAGPPVVRKATVVLGAILQTAAESGRIASNPVRLAKKRKLPERPEIVPLAPVTIEKLRARASPRDAVLLSVLAYAGLRPGEALALGGVKGTKTGRTRTVRLLSPLAADLREWRMRCGRPSDHELVFPGHDGKPWSEPAYQSWRRRAFKRALTAAGNEHARPYDLRHSFASLLIHEGRSVVDVARQLGHSATMTLRVYGHVLDEFADAPQRDAEGAILVARESSAAHRLHIAPGNGP